MERVSAQWQTALLETNQDKELFMMCPFLMPISNNTLCTDLNVLTRAIAKSNLF